MTERDDTSSDLSPPTEIEGLPYCVEMWDAEGQAVERLLARAVSLPLARAIFNALRSERPERRVTLRRDARILADSGE